VIKTLLICVALVLLSDSRASAFEWSQVQVTPTGSVSETYNDNITSTHEDAEEDFITEISPGIKAAYGTETLSWTVRGIVTQQIFARNSEYNDTEETLEGAYHQERSQYDRFDFKDSFSHTYEVEDISESLGKASGRAEYYHNLFEFKYERDLAQELTMNLLYDNELLKASGGGIADSMGNRIAAEVYYQLNPATTLIASYQFMIRNFDPGDDIYDNLISIGARRKIGERLTAEARVGVDYIDTHEDEYIKPRMTFSLTQEINDKNKASIYFSKLYDSTAYSEDLFNSWQTGLAWERELSARMACTAKGFYGNGKYAASGTKDTVFGGSLSSAYALTRNVKVNLDYGYSKVKSSEDEHEFEQNKIGAGVRLEF
jgi:opacity protein-like surface antigen